MNVQKHSHDQNTERLIEMPSENAQESPTRAEAATSTSIANGNGKEMPDQSRILVGWVGRNTYAVEENVGSISMLWEPFKKHSTLLNDMTNPSPQLQRLINPSPGNRRQCGSATENPLDITGSLQSINITESTRKLTLKFADIASMRELNDWLTAMHDREELGRAFVKKIPKLELFRLMGPAYALEIRVLINQIKRRVLEEGIGADDLGRVLAELKAGRSDEDRKRDKCACKSVSFEDVEGHPGRRFALVAAQRTMLFPRAGQPLTSQQIFRDTAIVRLIVLGVHGDGKIASRAIKDVKDCFRDANRLVSRFNPSLPTMRVQLLNDEVMDTEVLPPTYRKEESLYLRSSFASEQEYIRYRDSCQRVLTVSDYYDNLRPEQKAQFPSIPQKFWSARVLELADRSGVPLNEDIRKRILKALYTWRGEMECQAVLEEKLCEAWIEDQNVRLTSGGRERIGSLEAMSLALENITPQNLRTWIRVHRLR
ncbi:MAG: hypothetical protein Q9227_001102 [Pyrenula ochraceoflavens]